MSTNNNRAWAAVYLKETVDLAPATVVGIFVVALIGSDLWRPNSHLPSLVQNLGLVACFIGAWHGMLDRRNRTREFLRHVPLREALRESARWAAGATTLLLMFGVCALACWLSRAVQPDVYAALIEKTPVDERFSLDATAAATVAAVTFAAWSTGRFVLAWRGIVSRGVWALLLPAALVTLLAASPAVTVPIALALAALFSVYQGAQAQRLLRRGALLVVVLVVGHAALLWGSSALFDTLRYSYGKIGVDREWRLRHWTEDDGMVTTREGEQLPGEEWAESLRVDFGAALPPSYKQSRPRRSRREMEQDAAAVDHAKRWSRDPLWGGSFNRRSRLASIDRIDWGRLDVLVEDARGWLLLSADGRWLAHADWPGGGARAGDQMRWRRSRLDPPLAGRGIHGGRILNDDWVGVAGDEFWALDREGQFKQRQPLGFKYADVYAEDDGKGLRGFLGQLPDVRPDRIPVRVVVARPGKELLVREAVLETDDALTAGFGVLGALRPLPLNLLASTMPGATRVHTLTERFWCDPYFAEGAHRGWVMRGLGLTLLCGFIAWRWARVRAPSSQWIWVAAVLVVGPMGLVWMRLALPWVALENGRAVNLEPPAWPQPQLIGTEVYA